MNLDRQKLAARQMRRDAKDAEARARATTNVEQRAHHETVARALREAAERIETRSREAEGGWLL